MSIWPSPMICLYKSEALTTLVFKSGISLSEISQSILLFCSYSDSWNGLDR